MCIIICMYHNHSEDFNFYFDIKIYILFIKMYPASKPDISADIFYFLKYIFIYLYIFFFFFKFLKY